MSFIHTQWGRLGLQTRLLTAFGLLALIALLLAGTGYVSTKRVGAYVQEVGGETLPAMENLLRAQQQLEVIRAAQRTLLLPSLRPDERPVQRAVIDEAQRRFEHHFKEFRRFAGVTVPAAQIALFEAQVNEWNGVNVRFVETMRSLEALDVANPVALEAKQEGFRGDHHLAIQKAATQIFRGQAYTGGTDPTACRFGLWLKAYTTANPTVRAMMDRAKEPHARFHTAVAAVQRVLATGDRAGAERVYVEQLVPAAEETIGLFGELLAETAKARSLYEQLDQLTMVELKDKQAVTFGSLQQIVALQTADADERVRQAGAVTQQAGRVVVVAAGAGVAIALALGFGLAISITRKIHGVSDTLDAGSDQITAAAGQIASASSSLANGASEQAAALEETTATLSEIESMTKRTAEHAHGAKEVAGRARHAAEASDVEVKRMSEAMTAIGQATGEVEKIVKTIDEIAFQTNLLALNASVEAARAGEAGAGFAVVAGEVRSLAQRAAEAAKDSAERIGAASTASQTGRAMVASMQSQLVEILATTRQVDDAMEAIVVAAREQNAGLSQINSTMGEMERVTQSNAAAAEQSASSSEELHAQTVELRSAMQTLHAIVDGSDFRRTMAAPEVTPAVRRQPGGVSRMAAVG